MILQQLFIQFFCTLSSDANSIKSPELRQAAVSYCVSVRQ